MERAYGPITSSVDWCEPNHVYSPWIAEWFNTLSNIPGIVLGVMGLITARRRMRGHHRQSTAIQWAYFVPILVYAGSFVFHATLFYWGQLLDELPMVFGSCYLHYIATPPRYRNTAAPILFLVAVGITTAMAAWPASPLPLQLSYAATVAALIFRSARINGAHPAVRATGILSFAAVIYNMGSALWITDQNWCEVVQPLHFHAWWHLLTSIGTYAWIQFAAVAQAEEMKQPWADVGLFAAQGLPFGDTLPFVSRV